MKVKLTKPLEWNGRTIGPGTVVDGPAAKEALSSKSGMQIEDNAPDFNPPPNTPKKEVEKRTPEEVQADTLQAEVKTGTPSTDGTSKK